jgi:hypothetical protein
MSPAFDLNGAWLANDGGVYYIRHEGDLVTWAGLHASGFHMGMEFANDFQGTVGPDGTTLAGEWVDVPRGSTNSSGTLGLQIVEVPLPPIPPFPPPRGTMLELRQIPAETTGGFGATLWTKDGSSLGPQDIVAIDGKVQRYDVPLGENNPPCRDFSVMWGIAGKINWPTLPPTPFDYCSFVDDDWDGDGDFDFDVAPDWSRIEPGFWIDGWANQSFGLLGEAANTHILSLFDRFGRFHCEAAMYGRQNDSDHCNDAPVHLLPGWAEQGGNSVLVNGRPVEGRVGDVTDHRVIPGAPPPPNDALLFYLDADHTTQIELSPAAVVRVTGVVADDAGHENETAPEIHPVYALDIVQDFAGPRAEHTNLTGAWHADDVGTYYVRQIGGALWWLGMSRDQGRSFANVFRGTVKDNRIRGNWVDVPMGAGGVLSGGTLVLHGRGPSTQLVKVAESAGFGGTIWTKLYDCPATLPPRPIGPVHRGPLVPPVAR